jgi:hypothetical protein
MDETTKKEFKEILQTELAAQFKKELDPIKAKLANLVVDMQDVPKNTKETLERTRKAETNIDYFVNEQKKEGSVAKVNFHHIENHKKAILMVAERTTDKNTYLEVKKLIDT